MSHDFRFRVLFFYVVAVERLPQVMISPGVCSFALTTGGSSPHN